RRRDAHRSMRAPSRLDPSGVRVGDGRTGARALELRLGAAGGGGDAGRGGLGLSLGLRLLLRADVVVAVAAVDGAVAARDEGNLRHAPALVARGHVQLARGAPAVGDVDAEALEVIALLRALHLARLAAGRAAHGVVLQALGRVELLLACGEDERAVAIAT